MFGRKSNNHIQSEAGFTLMEIIVATSIFVSVVTALLGLLNYAVGINRRVQATRQVVQAARNFAEVLAREVRNGQIDYTSTACGINYGLADNSAVAIIGPYGERTCFQDGVVPGVDGTRLLMIKTLSDGTTTQTDQVGANEVTVRDLRFRVVPVADPAQSGNPNFQPIVTATAVFVATGPKGEEITLPYQTTVAVDSFK